MKLKIATRLKSVIDGTSDAYHVVNEFDSWSLQKQNEFINESFFDMINYSYDHVEYYNKLFVDYGLNPKDFTDISMVKKIPILTKDLVRENYSKLQSDEISKIKFQDRRSGGTTGEPIRSLVSKEAAAYELFTYFKGLEWMGWNPGMKMIKLFGGSLGVSSKFNFRQYIYNKSINSYFIPAFSLNQHSVLDYYNFIKKQDTVCILGYASAVINLVGFLKQLSLTLSNVKLVITTSEQLVDDWYIQISEYFQCNIRSYYGCGEIGSLGYQMKNVNDKSYKVPHEHVFIDNLDGSKELNITQLFNIAQPLIRYQNGDVGEISFSNKDLKITNFMGRTADFFVKYDGSLVSPIFGTVSIQNTRIPVQKYQYLQYKDRIIEFRYVMETGSLSDSYKDIINSIVSKVMEENVNVVFNQTTNFVISNSGKHRIALTVDELYYK